MKKTIKPVALAIGATLTLGAASTVTAVDMDAMKDKAVGMAKDMAKGMMGAEARDMQGNKVDINPETGFTYGGDGMATYAGGKLATGKKDPTVCGTFSGSSCSMPHLK
ncbi:MAG: hypothetical protein AAF387_02140 [Pseudomonadota bacterium]